LILLTGRLNLFIFQLVNAIKVVYLILLTSNFDFQLLDGILIINMNEVIGR